LKLKVPFMPRTDFGTMLHLVCDTMTSAAATEFRKSLLLADLFTHIHTSDLNKLKWSFVSRQEQNGTARVTAMEFLKDLVTDEGDPENLTDLITFGDTNRNSQIGALGKKVERVLDGKDDKLLGPIIEFRKLEVVDSKRLTSWGPITVGGNEHEPARVVSSASLLQALEVRFVRIHDYVRGLNSS
jgi:hypothetical protein